jgi:hypothetical protein
MLTREEAKEYYLKLLNKEIEEHGEDFIFVSATKIGKNTWTVGEFKKAIENNINPEEYSTNPIDDLLRYDEYLREHGRDIKDSDSWKELMS